MIYKFLLTLSLASLSSFAFAPKAFGQERPKCYIIDDSGELTDLTDICDVSQKPPSGTGSTASDSQNVINNNINIGDSQTTDTESSANDSVRVLGNSDRKLGSISSTYYLDNEIGSNYTAYVRSYKAPLTSIDRQTLRNKAFKFNANLSRTEILRQGRGRTPFIIYRYQN